MKKLEYVFPSPNWSWMEDLWILDEVGVINQDSGSSTFHWEKEVLILNSQHVNWKTRAASISPNMKGNGRVKRP